MGFQRGFSSAAYCSGGGDQKNLGYPILIDLGGVIGPVPLPRKADSNILMFRFCNWRGAPEFTPQDGYRRLLLGSIGKVSGQWRKFFSLQKK